MLNFLCILEISCVVSRGVRALPSLTALQSTPLCQVSISISGDFRHCSLPPDLKFCVPLLNDHAFDVQAFVPAKHGIGSNGHHCQRRPRALQPGSTKSHLWRLLPLLSTVKKLIGVATGDAGNAAGSVDARSLPPLPSLRAPSTPSSNSPSSLEQPWTGSMKSILLPSRSVLTRALKQFRCPPPTPATSSKNARARPGSVVLLFRRCGISVGSMDRSAQGLVPGGRRASHVLSRGRAQSRRAF